MCGLVDERMSIRCTGQGCENLPDGNPIMPALDAKSGGQDMSKLEHTLWKFFLCSIPSWRVSK